MKIFFILFPLFIVPGVCFAQQQEDPAKRSRELVDRAIEQARVVQKGDKPSGDLLSPENLRRQGGIDPAQLAMKYKNVSNHQFPNEMQLQVFISTSLPPKALQMLGQQAKETGAVLVLRGMRGKFGSKGALDETTKALEPAVAAGAKVQIDPEAFTRNEVTAVPTFVLAVKEEGCQPDLCKASSYSLVGDVSIEYALEHWSAAGGAVGKTADALLGRLSKGK